MKKKNKNENKEEYVMIEGSIKAPKPEKPEEKERSISNEEFRRYIKGE